MWKKCVSQSIDQGMIRWFGHVERMGDERRLRWFGHVERMGDERMAKRVYESDVRVVGRRGSRRKCWMDGVRGVG